MTFAVTESLYALLLAVPGCPITDVGVSVRHVQQSTGAEARRLRASSNGRAGRPAHPHGVPAAACACWDGWKGENYQTAAQGDHFGAGNSAASPLSQLQSPLHDGALRNDTGLAMLSPRPAHVLGG